MFVDDIVNAIATQEGWFSSNASVLPRVNNNPGNLEFAAQTNAVKNGRFAKFRTPQEGITALYRQIWLYIALGRSLRQLITSWAPPNENNTSIYLQNVAHWTGIDPEIPLMQLIPPLRSY